MPLGTASTWTIPSSLAGRGAWASPHCILALQGGIPLLAAGQCDVVYAGADLWWPHAAGYWPLPAVGTLLLLHGHIIHIALFAALGHRCAAHSPWACFLDHLGHR